MLGVRTLSLFRCEGCGTTLLYETMLDEELEGPFSLDAYDIPNPEWVIEDEFEFLKASKLLYYSPLPYLRQEKSILGSFYTGICQKVLPDWY